MVDEPDKKPPPGDEEPVFIAMGGSCWAERAKHKFDWAGYLEKVKANPAYYGFKEAPEPQHGLLPEFRKDPK